MCEQFISLVQVDAMKDYVNLLLLLGAVLFLQVGENVVLQLSPFARSARAIAAIA